MPVDRRATLPDGIEVRPRSAPSSGLRQPTAQADMTGALIEHQVIPVQHQSRPSNPQANGVEVNIDDTETLS